MKTFITAFLFGLFGAVAVALFFAMHWPTWVMFIAWVSFYLFGRTIKSSLSALLQIVLGIIMGACIQIIEGLTSGTAGQLSFPIAVFLFIGSLAYISRIKAFRNIPAWFLGLIVFFGIQPKLNILSVSELIIPLVEIAQQNKALSKIQTVE